MPGDAPEHVWVRYRDGVFYEDLPVIYRGMNSDGQDVWEALLPRTETPSGFGLDADMPPNTVLEAQGCPECEDAP